MQITQIDTGYSKLQTLEQIDYPSLKIDKRQDVNDSLP